MTCELRDKMAGYKEWHEKMHRDYDNSTYWSRIGDWGYPIQGNDSWACGTFNHLCYEKWKSIVDDDKWEKAETDYICSHCSEVVPEGLRMVAFLEKL